MPAPLTPSTPARSITPVTPGTPGPLTPTTPTTPTFSQVLSHPPIGSSIPGTVGSLPSSGKAVSSKGKKSKEEKEREKEMRKQKLRIQQEQERQWKILQQRRALEQQRQQQQQQQENVLLRQELKKQQQAKGTKVTEEQKKKRLSKGGRRAPLQGPKEQGRTTEKAGAGSLRDDVLGSPSFQNNMKSLEGSENSMDEQLLPVVSSFSAAPRANANALASNSQYQNDSSLEFLVNYDGKGNGLLEERQSDPSVVTSSNEIPSANQEEYHSVQTDTNRHFQPPSVWQKEPVEEELHHTTDEPLWEQSRASNQLEQQKQPNSSLALGQVSQTRTVDRHSLWTSGELQPESLQDHLGSDNVHSRVPIPEQHMRPAQEVLHDEQSSHGNLGSHEQMIFHDERQQSWVSRPPQHPSAMPSSQSAILGQQLSRESGQMVCQSSVTDSVQSLPFSAQHEVSISTSEQHQQQAVELQHPPQIPVMHWQEELSQVRAQVAAAHDLHPPQSVPPPPAPPPPPPPPPPPLPPPSLPSTQQQHTGPLQQYELTTGWPQQNQLPPQVQPQPVASYPQTPQPHQLHGPSNSQGGIPQTQFQALQQVPVQMAPNQHPNQPLSSQPQDSSLQQPQQQQQDIVQRQQREQLIRAQQQQFFQMLQHQQVLQQQQQQHQQQQQQQNAAIQPGFARVRLNQVMNTKDLPEIDTEEEHQERLRYLYRQRQAQKQQQMQVQAQLLQQAWIQQLTNGGGQGVVPPGILPVDTSNPQMLQQFAQQMRPQMPDLAQQQLFAEYQRRIQQRQDLGQQTVQYDKVLQELQQQQGIPAGGSSHSGSPFLEIPQQRFALRQTTPIVQPGLKPIMPFGLDGQFVGQQQQLYRMQLQQQMIMQQQKKEPTQKNTPRASTATGKVDMAKGNSEYSGDVNGDKIKRSATPAHGDGMHGSVGNTNVLQEEMPEESKDPGSGSENQQDGTKGKSPNELVNEVMTTTENLRETHHIKDQINCEINPELENAEVAAESKMVAGEEEKASTSGEDFTSCVQANKEQCKTSDLEDKQEDSTSVSDKDRNVVEGQVEHAETVKEKTVEGLEGVARELFATDGESVLSRMPSDAVRDLECKSGEGYLVEGTQILQEPRKPKVETVQINDNNKFEENESKKEVLVQEGELTCKSDAFAEVKEAPVQPHHIPTQAPPVPPPQAQHFLMQQQFMGLQQQFLQMQQQRQVLVQQYQQLQQQLHQAGGQDPVLAGQVMAVQSQGQVLQQQMLQAWQQMQLIQQQLQLGGVPVQQQIAIQQQPSQAQQQPQPGPQWSTPGHPIGAQPGVFPLRPGVVGLQRPLQSGMPLTEKVGCIQF